MTQGSFSKWSLLFSATSSRLKLWAPSIRKPDSVYRRNIKIHHLVFWIIISTIWISLWYPTLLEIISSSNCLDLRTLKMVFCNYFSWVSTTLYVTADVRGQGQWKTGQLWLVLVRPERQTTGSFFFIIRTDRHRTGFFTKFRTESGQRTKPRQTDTGQKIRTESGQQTDNGHDFPENPDKNETRTGHRQCCPPTSVSRWHCHQHCHQHYLPHFRVDNTIKNLFQYVRADFIWFYYRMSWTKKISEKILAWVNSIFHTTWYRI